MQTGHISSTSSFDRKDSCNNIPTFKVILLGDVGVGKTSIFLRIRDGEFNEGVRSSVGADCCSRTLKADNKQVQLTLWDTAGVERFRTLTRNFYRNAHAVLLTFDVNNSSTLYCLNHWVQDVKVYAPNALRFLVGNKKDIEVQVTQKYVEEFVQTYDCESVLLTSAKTGQGIPEVLAALSQRLISLHGQERHTLENSWLEDSIYVRQGPSSNRSNAKNSACCG